MELKNKKILIVDDDPKNLKILKIRLEKDFDLLEACSGEEALKIYEESKPALILLDIMMEGMDGYEVCEKVKADNSLTKSKVILLTGKSQTEDKLEGYKRGADDYLIKPFNGEELKAKVKVFMKLFNLEDQLKSDNDSLKGEIERKDDCLIKAERMAYVGLNTAEIIHNLKNPLSVIHILAKRYEKGRPPENFSQKLNENIDKTFEIIKTIMTNSRQDPEDQFKVLDLNELIKKELDFLTFNSNFDKKAVELRTNLDSKDLVFGNPFHYQQILGNLVKNAVEALEGSERRTIDITTIDSQGCVLLKIADSGEGIPQENLEKIFDSKFSTKVDSEDPLSGTGLGLAYCRKIMESYGGRIDVDSEVGKGTTFTLKFWAKKGEMRKAS